MTLGGIFFVWYLPGAFLFVALHVMLHFIGAAMDGSHVLFMCTVVGGACWLAACLPFMVRRLHDIGKSGLLLLPLLLLAGISALACWVQAGIGNAAPLMLLSLMVGCVTGTGMVVMDLFFTGSHSTLDRAVLGPILIATLAYGIWLFTNIGFRRGLGQLGPWGREMR
jgi:uncharacterized membrane protein YhaH (DUF805 family)